MSHPETATPLSPSRTTQSQMKKDPYAHPVLCHAPVPATYKPPFPASTLDWSSALRACSRSPCSSIPHGLKARSAPPSQTEIQNLGVPALGDKNVSRFD